MNSLESYKEQCYNIGSPTPSPSKAPLTSLSKTIASEFTFTVPTSSPKSSQTRSKVPVPAASKTTRSRKRSLSSQDSSPTSSPKKSKMMSKEDLKEMFNQQRQENKEIMDKMNTRMDNLYSKLDTITDNNIASNKAVQDTMSDVQVEIRDLKSSVDDNRVKFEEKLVQLEGQFNKFQENALNTMISKEEINDIVRPMIDEVVPKIKDEVKKDILSPVKATWNAIQAEKISEHDHSLIVFGLEAVGNPIEAAGKFLKDDLKVDDETLLKISVKQAFKLGKGEGSKLPPFLIKFGHPSERNLILSHSKNLAGSKIKIEKHIPKNYQEKYKEFKKISWKLKTLPEMDYMTQIIFDAHSLVLRYKRKDAANEKYHWTVHSTFVPPMESKIEGKSSLKVPQGSKATPPPEAAATNKANVAVFMTLKGMAEKQTADTLKNNLKEYLKEEHKELLEEVKVTKRSDLIILYFDSWYTAKAISSTYKSQFNGCDVTFELFAQDDPTKMHL